MQPLPSFVRVGGGTRTDLKPDWLPTSSSNGEHNVATHSSLLVCLLLLLVNARVGHNFTAPKVEGLLSSEASAASTGPHEEDGALEEVKEEGWIQLQGPTKNQVPRSTGGNILEFGDGLGGT